MSAHMEAVYVAVARLRDLDLEAAARECFAHKANLERLGWSDPQGPCNDIQTLAHIRFLLQQIDEIRDRRSIESPMMTRAAGRRTEHPELRSVGSDHGGTLTHASGGASTAEMYRPRAFAREIAQAKREGFLAARFQPGEHQCAAFRENGKCAACLAEAEKAFPMPIDYDHVSERHPNG